MKKGNKLRILYLAIFLIFVFNNAFVDPIETVRVKGFKKDVAALLIKGPYLQSATSTSIIIRWRTDVPDIGVVKYGIDANNLKTFIKDSASATEHIIKLSGLKPATKYFYSIGGVSSTLQGNSDNYFQTLPVPGSTGIYRIAAFGDCGNNSINQKNVRDEVVKYLGNNYLNSWLLLGDNAYEYGTDAEYQKNFFNVFKDDLLKKYPLFPAPGNHDYREVDKNTGLPKLTHDVAYYQNFSMPQNGEAGGVASNNPSYYSFDVGNIHFLSLDSYGKEADGERMFDTLSPQVQWVKKDLKENKNKGWVIAYWHHPPYTMGSHNSDKERELIKIRENFIQILERSGVDLVLTGHSHSYERSKLLNGHFGNEASFKASEHWVSQSSALYNGSENSCPYIKNDIQNKGIVYVVSGSAGKIDSKTQTSFPHDAMYYSNAINGGALFMEVENNRLNLKWICADGIIRDDFTMMKNVNKKTTIKIKKGQTAILTASYVGDYNWNSSNEQTRSIQVSPVVGKSTYSVKDKFNCVKDVFEVVVSK
jgi:acid phosphatase type 7